METFECPECKATIDYVTIEYVARQDVKIADYLTSNYVDRTDQLEDGLTMCSECSAQIELIKGR